MVITDQQLKGNWGEQYIAAKLSANGCFVRHVLQGHDTGIDLYCETIEEGLPFLHFWCQIKTSSKWKGKAKFLVYNPKKKSHVKYWLSQPVPVFIFLVPDRRDEESLPFYICRSIDFLVDPKKVNSYLKIEKPEDLKKFITESLPGETFLWELKNGKVTHLPTAKKQYIKTIPGGIVHKFEKGLFPSIVNTIQQLCKDIIFDRSDPDVILNKTTYSKIEITRFKHAKLYAKSLEILIYEKNDLHYHNYETLGYYYEVNGIFEAALRNYENSLNKLNVDPNKKNQDRPWDSTIDRVEGHISRIKTKMN